MQKLVLQTHQQAHLNGTFQELSEEYDNNDMINFTATVRNPQITGDRKVDLYQSEIWVVDGEN